MKKSQNTTNHVIDWKSESAAAYEQRRNYFFALRSFFEKLENLGNPEVEKLMDEHGVAAVEIDDFPRVNLQRSQS